MKHFLIIITFLNCSLLFSQKTLDLHYNSLFGRQKSFQFFNNSEFSYKLKGHVFYTTHKLVNMQDSILVFDNDSSIKLSEIKAIKIKGVKISPYFFGAGILFFILDTGHNIAFGNKIINEKAVLIGSILVVAGVIVNYLQNKHIHIHKNSVLRIIDADYLNLNIKN